ncbi:Zinc finger protein 227 [Mizuhopecten yessoensis]|uniref:Zinc finger protein 227 n=1 Tax=Mizuhopecten yessoensis TaxID=6573 RepID=A0A210PQJ0_MIZYE|nr:Zinc finger protein 227 [Mizuhopecten yessoensis]
MSDGQNIELVLHMVNKMCGELVDKGQEYFLVTASPNKALNIGSAKGRQFLQANTDVVQRFIKHCYNTESTCIDIIKFEVEDEMDDIPTPQVLVPNASQLSVHNPDAEVQTPTSQDLDSSDSATDRSGDRVINSEQDGTEEKLLDEEIEDMDCNNDIADDFSNHPSPSRAVSTPGLTSSTLDLKTENVAVSETAKKRDEISVTSVSDHSDREAVVELTTPALLPNTPDDSSAAKDKKAMMETMGLTEKQKSSSPKTRRTRSSVDREEEEEDSVATPSPARKIRSSRNCSTPVWLDLIPKRNRKQKSGPDVCFTIKKESTGGTGVRKPHKLTQNSSEMQQNKKPETSDDQTPVRVEVKSSTRQVIKRKSMADDVDKSVSSKRSKQSQASNTSTTTNSKQTTPTESPQQSRLSKRLASKSDKEATPSETPKQTRLSKRLTSKSDKKATPAETPKQTQFDKEATPSETPKQTRLSKRLTSEFDESAISSETSKEVQASKPLTSESDGGASLSETPKQAKRLTSESDEETIPLVTIKQNETSKMLTRRSGKKAAAATELPELSKVSRRLKAKKRFPGSELVEASTESKCDVCDKVYSTLQNMRRHRITHSDFKAYKCTFCSQRFHYIQYLREHVVGCLNNPQRVKYRNHERMRPSPVMMRHLTIVPSPDEPDTFINLPFSEMSDKLTEVNSQEEIQNLTAENTEQEILDVLDKVKASQPEVNLQEARRLHRAATKEFREGINSEEWMTEDGQYKCYICEKIIANQYNLYRHLQTHTESRRYKCTFCERRFAVGQYLKDHVISCVKNRNRVTSATNRRQVDPEVKRKIIILPSTVEDGTFVNAEIGEDSEGVDVDSELDLGHLPAGSTGDSDKTRNWENTEDEPLEESTQVLDDAMATEDQEAVYKCSVREWNNYYAHRSYDGTGKSAFKLSAQMISVFKKEKQLGAERVKKKVSSPYHCTVCNLKKFNRAETLRRHLFSHMGNNHQCEICGMVFLYQDYLKAHVLQQHFAIKRNRKSRSSKCFTSQPQSSGSLSCDKAKPDVVSADSDLKTNGSQSSDGKAKSLDDKAQNLVDEAKSSDDKEQSSDVKEQSSDDKEQSSDDKEQSSNDKEQSSNDKEYTCDNCGKVFKIKYRLNVHKSMCLKKTGKTSRLRHKLDRKCVRKLQNFKKRILYQCVECQNKFFKYENLLWHQFSNHGLASFTKCPVCSETTDNGRLLTHLIERHQSYQCQQKTSKAAPPQYNFQCNQCDKKFTKELTMLIHQQKHMSGKDQFDPALGNQCPVCKVNFVTFGNMRRHFKVVHSDEKPFMCHLCGKSFKTNDTLKSHVKIHDREKHLKFRCKTCGKGFFRNRLLKEHETLHIPGATTCMCDICGKRFRLKPNLSKHMNSVHNVERNHVCQTCGKTFKLKEQLKNHMRYHVIKDGKVGEVGNKYGKIYKCETCGKFCPSSYSLKIHKTSHSSERPYPCEVCGRRFKVKSKVQRHIQNVHNFTGKTRRPRKTADSKQIITATHSMKEEAVWSSQNDENIAESIVEVIVNSEAELVESTKMYSLLDHSYRPSTSGAASTQHLSPNDQAVINEAVKGITAEEDTETNYIIQDVQEIEDQPGMYIVSTDTPVEAGSESNETQTFSLSVDEGPKTLIYYITTD